MAQRRTGRLRITGRIGGLTAAEVEVVPDDGSAPIFLAVTALAVDVEAAEPVIARLKAYVRSIDLEGLDEDDEPYRVRASTEPGAPPAVFPDVQVTDRDGTEVLATGLTWRAGWNSRARIRLHRDGTEVLATGLTWRAGWNSLARIRLRGKR